MENISSEKIKENPTPSQVDNRIDLLARVMIFSSPRIRDGHVPKSDDGTGTSADRRGHHVAVCCDPLSSER